MPKIAKVTALFIVVLFVIFGITPLLVGIYVQQHFQSLLTFYNSFPGVHVTSLYYKRGWLYSYAVIRVDVNNVYYLNTFHLLGVEQKKVPHYYVIDQYIQHGPFFYGKNVPFRYGLAIIHDILRPTLAVNILLSKLGIAGHSIKNQEYISFGLNHSYYLQLLDVNVPYEKNNTFLKIAKLDSQITFKPFSSRLEGKLNIQSILIENQGDSLVSPHLHYEFNMYPTNMGLWAGTHVLRISKMIAAEKSGLKGVLQDIYYYSDSQVAAESWGTDKALSIRQLQFNGDMFGPFQLQISLKNMDANALSELFSACHVIIERGELYPSQLTEKIVSLIPTVIHHGSDFTLKTFDIDTPQGRVHINGDLRWDKTTDSVPDDLLELLKWSAAHFNLVITKTFANDLIHFYATSPLINDPAMNNEEIVASENIDFNMENNSLLIEALVNDGRLRELDALDLLQLQKNMVPVTEYDDEVGKILWNYNMTLPTSYYLYWGYAGLEDSIVNLETMIQNKQDQLEADMQAQLKAFLNKGYLQENKKEYSFSFMQNNGRVMFGGKLLRDQ